MRLADARQAVESAGLGLALSADVAGDVGGRTIAAQTPPAGSLVPPGATVTVRLASSGVPPWIPLAGTGALAGLLGYQIARRRHRPRRVRPGDVRARATDPQVTTEVQHRGDPVDVEVRIQADVGRDAAVVTEGLGIISESSERQ